MGRRFTSVHDLAGRLAETLDAKQQRTTYVYNARGGDNPSSYPSPYQFAGVWGYQTEPDAGHGLDLMYLYQRYYEPDTGRFLSRDPIRWAGGRNLYGYGAVIRSTSSILPAKDASSKR